MLLSSQYVILLYDTETYFRALVASLVCIRFQFITDRIGVAFPSCCDERIAQSLLPWVIPAVIICSHCHQRCGIEIGVWEYETRGSWFGFWLS